MLPAPVAAYLEEHRQAHLETFLELLRIPSVAGANADACERAAAWLAGHLEALGLDVEIAATPGQPNVLAEAHVSDAAPTLLIYGHYDVQPPDPLAEWDSDPFEPVVRDGRVQARGADDDKGQHFAQLMALEAWIRAGGGLPVNVKVLLEGEEEIGSPHLEPFLADRADRLRADAAVISDSAFFAAGVPSITYALRGLAYVEITMTGPSTDVHSGVHGGAVANPINALARLVGQMHDDDGRITLPGFYDDVAPVRQQELEAWRQLPFDEGAYAAGMGLDALGGGERGRGVLERRWARPTLDANGIFGGYTDEGAKTIIPARATVKISTRLVPHQAPERIVTAFESFVAERTPPGLRSSVHVHAGARPVLLNPDSPAMAAGAAALAEAFGRPPVLIRSGASVPITEMIQRLLGLDTVLMGFGLPEDRIHSPNEKFDLAQLYGGSVAAAAFLGNLREIQS